jgi:hypothetical protein
VIALGVGAAVGAFMWLLRTADDDARALMAKGRLNACAAPATCGSIDGNRASTEIGDVRYGVCRSVDGDAPYAMGELVFADDRGLVHAGIIRGGGVDSGGYLVELPNKKVETKPSVAIFGRICVQPAK